MHSETGAHPEPVSQRAPPCATRWLWRVSAAACALILPVVAALFATAGAPPRISTPAAQARRLAVNAVAASAITSHALAPGFEVRLTSDDTNANHDRSGPLDLFFDDDENDDDDDELARHDIGAAPVQHLSKPLRHARTGTEALSLDAHTRANQFLLETVRRL